MKHWNVYHFQYGRSGLVRRLIYRGLQDRSDIARLSSQIERLALIARHAHEDDRARLHD